MIDLNSITNESDLLKKAKWLEGKTLLEVTNEIKKHDSESRVITKGHVGYVIEKGFFEIDKNSAAEPDIAHLGIEIKTCPLKFNKDKSKLSIKEPLSLNIINYVEEVKNKNLKESTLYKKNHKILFVFYIHDKDKERSKYLIKYVFLWEINQAILNELEPDYQKILEYIKAGKAHEIHQYQHKYLTICPKHSGTFKNPNCSKSKRTQPFSDKLAEVRAFRLKNRYMNLVIRRYLGKEEKLTAWNY